MGMEDVRNYIKRVATDVNEEIEKQLSRNDLEQIKDLILHQHRTGGKRLRPSITMLWCEFLGGDYQENIRLATLCELMHTASLQMDDVVDFDRTRRGKPTTMAIYGLGSAVMSGVTILSEAITLAAEHDPQLLKILIEAMRKLTIGNSEELIRVKPLDEDQYLRVIEFKTASLFQAASNVGAVLAGADTPTRQKAALYGYHIGMMYQLADDLVDIEKCGSGKMFGDLEYGLATLPIIYTYRMSPKDRVRGLIERMVNKRGLTYGETEEIISEVSRLDAIGYVRDSVDEHIKEARTIIESIDGEDESKKVLYDIPEMMLSAMLGEIEKDGKEDD